VFPNHGTILDLYLENNSRDPSTCEIDVNSDSQIIRIILLGIYFEESELWKHYSYLGYVEWKGYGEYP